MRFFLHVVLNKCGLCHFRYFVQLITVTVSFESLFFVRSVFCVFVFVFVFSPVSLYFIFSCLGLLESLRSGHFLFSSSRFLIFDTFCAFSSLGFTFCNTIPFGWNLSAYVYHSTGLLVSHYFRSIGIPCSLYIDDRHSSQIRLPRGSSLGQSLEPEKVNLVSAQIASFLVSYTLVRLGYCFGLQKFILQPSQSVPYLGF